jgi:hypothetical protein
MAMIALVSLLLAGGSDPKGSIELCKAAEEVTGEDYMCWVEGDKLIAYWACQLRIATKHGTIRTSSSTCWTKLWPFGEHLFLEGGALGTVVCTSATASVSLRTAQVSAPVSVASWKS